MLTRMSLPTSPAPAPKQPTTESPLPTEAMAAEPVVQRVLPKRRLFARAAPPVTVHVANFGDYLDVDIVKLCRLANRRQTLIRFVPHQVHYSGLAAPAIPPHYRFSDVWNIVSDSARVDSHPSIPGDAPDQGSRAVSAHRPWWTASVVAAAPSARAADGP